MKLTKKKAIEECKKLWEEIEASGLSKDDFLRTTGGEYWIDKEYFSNCPLCQHDSDFGKDTCSACPLVKKYRKKCSKLGFHANCHSTEFIEAVRGL